MTYSLTAIAMAASLAASPPVTTNMAANAVSGTGGAAENSASIQAPKASAALPEKVYCTSGTITGSRVVKTECKTKSQWAKEGVDVNDLMNSDQD